MSVVGIMGGSYNPIHNGHLMVASYIAQYGEVDEVWLTVTPRNPLKSDVAMAPDDDRLQMARLAVEGADVPLRVSDVEFGMPVPSYTIDTLRTLAARYPEHSFRLIIGSDNWLDFSRWRSWREIVDEFGVMVYPRPGYPVDGVSLPAGVSLVEAPQVEVSSTFVRRALAERRCMKWFVPDAVLAYIAAKGLYTQQD